MGKNIRLAALTAEKKEWDFAIVMIREKPPIMVYQDTGVKIVDNTLILGFDTAHPMPQNEHQQQARYSVNSFIWVDDIFAVDYYKENKIIVPESGKIIT